MKITKLHVKVSVVIDIYIEKTGAHTLSIDQVVKEGIEEAYSKLRTAFKEGSHLKIESKPAEAVVIASVVEVPSNNYA